VAEAVPKCEKLSNVAAICLSVKCTCSYSIQGWNWRTLINEAIDSYWQWYYRNYSGCESITSIVDDHVYKWNHEMTVARESMFRRNREMTAKCSDGYKTFVCDWLCVTMTRNWYSIDCVMRSDRLSDLQWLRKWNIYYSVCSIIIDIEMNQNGLRKSFSQLAGQLSCESWLKKCLLAKMAISAQPVCGLMTDFITVEKQRSWHAEAVLQRSWSDSVKWKYPWWLQWLTWKYWPLSGRLFVWLTSWSKWLYCSLG